MRKISAGVFSAPLPPQSRPFGPVRLGFPESQAPLPCSREHSSAHHLQVRQREKREHPSGVLRHAAVAHRRVTELPLQHAERMLDSRAKPRLQRLKLSGEPLQPALGPLLRSQALLGDVPLDRAPV